MILMQVMIGAFLAMLAHDAYRGEHPWKVLIAFNLAAAIGLGIEWLQERERLRTFAMTINEHRAKMAKKFGVPTNIVGTFDVGEIQPPTLLFECEEVHRADEMVAEDPADFCRCGHRRSEHTGPLGGCWHQYDGARDLCSCLGFRPAVIPITPDMLEDADPPQPLAPRLRPTDSGISFPEDDLDPFDVCGCAHKRYEHAAGGGKCWHRYAVLGDPCSCGSFKLRRPRPTITEEKPE